ncbi:Hsp90 co-chaperone Cdc37 [Cryomyces antarcticus]
MGPLNYSKWDNLELSDDSDVEVHPNVDKRSFIRAKQAQIHQEREHRRSQISTLKYQRIINDGLLTRIDRLLNSVQPHQASSEDAGEVLFQALIESAGDPAEDHPPSPPEGVRTNVKEGDTYSRMMASIVDQMKKEVDNTNPEDRYKGYIDGTKAEKNKVLDVQQEYLVELAALEKEEGRKITSDSIHTGFDVSSVSKVKPTPKSTTATASKTATPELLNPSTAQRPPLNSMDSGQSSGADADIEDGGPSNQLKGDASDDENIEPSVLGKAFAKIKVGDYRASLQYIFEHPTVIAQRETDGLLIEALHSQMAGRDDYARQCVHQALLIQYCQKLGRDGVGLFFKRVTTPGHQAHTLFLDDFRTTYARIRSSAAELVAERAKEAADNTGNELIQLHAVDPTTTISITIPDPSSNEPAEQEARRLFDAFPPGLQRALETHSLEEINKVLAKMSVEEAEEVVGQLGESDMLNLQSQVIDATTEEGKKDVEEIERSGRMPHDASEGREAVGGPAEDGEMG